MRTVIGVGTIAFTASLGVVVGQRMSSEAMAVVIGVVCGVLAGIPTSVLLLVVMRAQQRRSGNDQPPSPQAQYPPVIVVGGMPQQLQAPRDPGMVDGEWRQLSAPRREFRVIGEE